MSADPSLRGIRETSQQRLEEARAEARSLIGMRDPQVQRATLARIVRLGKRTLDASEGVAGPSLLSHVHMQMAAALFDLAALEPDPDRRAKAVAAATRSCDLSLRVAIASRAPFLSLKIFPWAMVVLAGGLRSAAGAQSTRLQRVMATCAKALTVLDAQARRDAREGARALFRGQLLVTAADVAKDPVDRRVLLERARETVREGRRLAVGAGDFDLAGQAEDTHAGIVTRLAKEA